MNFSDELVTSIDVRIAEAREQIAVLEGALAALSEQLAPNTNGAAVSETAAVATGGTVAAVAERAPHAAAGPRRRRTARSELAPERLAAVLETMLSEREEGLSATAIAKESGASYSQVLELLRGLERDGEIRRSGARRAGVWRRVSDEERIAARVAELERLAAR